MARALLRGTTYPPSTGQCPGFAQRLISPGSAGLGDLRRCCPGAEARGKRCGPGAPSHRHPWGVWDSGRTDSVRGNGAPRCYPVTSPPVLGRPLGVLPASCVCRRDCVPPLAHTGSGPGLAGHRATLCSVCRLLTFSGRSGPSSRTSSPPSTSISSGEHRLTRGRGQAEGGRKLTVWGQRTAQKERPESTHLLTCPHQPARAPGSVLQGRSGPGAARRSLEFMHLLCLPGGR